MNFENDITARSNASQEEAKMIVGNFEKMSLSRKHILHKRNKVCNNYFFLEKGLLRFSFLQGEKDLTAWIVFENTFFSDIFSLVDNKPSFFEIIALENSVVYSIPKDKLETLLSSFPALHVYLRKTWESNFRNIAEVKLLQQFGDAKMCYEFFLKNQDWMKRVPQKLLASVIGITPHSLSRIRRRK
jgi:signal-transduction protein with cAMP-binding, CBS, and nucleotidyltransferase domain